MVMVDAGELEDAVLMVSDAGTSAEAWVCRDTGQVFVRSELVPEDLAPVPDDVEDSDRYIPVPTVHSLDLGLQVVFDFVDAAMPEDEARVSKMFKSPGAYRRFSDLVDERDLRDRWHAFRDAQTQAALSGWCEQNGLELAG